MSGSYFINSGSYGCVYRPAQPCRGSTTAVADADNKVSKLFSSKRSATEEATEHRKINSAIDPNGLFTLKLYEECDMDRSRISESELYKCPNYLSTGYIPQLIYAFGGSDINLHGHKTKLGRVTFIDLLAAMRPLFVGLTVLTANNMVHKDIKTLNTLYNPATNKMVIIDFGLASKMDEIYNRESSSRYIFYPSDFRLHTKLRDIANKSSSTSYSKSVIHNAALPLADAMRDPISWDRKYSMLAAGNSGAGVDLMYNYIEFSTYYGLDESFAQQFKTKYNVDIDSLLPNNKPFEQFYDMLHTLYVDLGMHAAFRPNDVTAKFAPTANTIDVYMVGVMILDLLVESFNRNTFGLSKSTVFYNNINYSVSRAHLTNLLKDVIDLISEMANQNAFKRLNATQALARYDEMMKKLTTPTRNIHNPIAIPVPKRAAPVLPPPPAPAPIPKPKRAAPVLPKPPAPVGFGSLVFASASSQNSTPPKKAVINPIAIPAPRPRGRPAGARVVHRGRKSKSNSLEDVDFNTPLKTTKKSSGGNPLDSLNNISR